MNDDDLPPVKKWASFIIILDNGQKSSQSALLAAAGFSHAIDRVFNGTFAVFGENCQRFHIRKRQRGEKVGASDV